MDCCVCGSDRSEPWARGWDFEYETSREEFEFRRCAGCGHVYLSPRPDASELSRIYPPDYYAYDMSKSVNPLALRVKKALEARKVGGLLKHLSTKESPTCLDIGCGDGRLLDVLAARGVPPRNLHGVELNEAVVRALAAKGYNAHVGRIEDLDLGEGRFDFIIMFQAIEHVEDPAAIFRAVARSLAPGGVFVVETPNAVSLDARVFRRRYWGGYHFPRHYNLFTASSLTRLAERIGLRTVKTETFICAVFWIYPFHHWLRERGAPRAVYRFFWPMSNPILLGVFAIVDAFLAPFGLAANLRGVFRKPAL